MKHLAECCALDFEFIDLSDSFLAFGSIRSTRKLTLHVKFSKKFCKPSIYLVFRKVFYSVKIVEDIQLTEKTLLPRLDEVARIRVPLHTVFKLTPYAYGKPETA